MKNSEIIRTSSRPYWRRVRIFALSIGGAAILGLVAVFFYQDKLVEKLLRSRDIAAFLKTHPGYTLSIGSIHYELLDNRLDLDSVTVLRSDSAFLCSVRELSLEGIGWRALIKRGVLTPEHLAQAEVDARGVAVLFPRSQYKVHCTRLRASVADSVLSVDSLELYAPADVEQFFSESRYRRTRFQLSVQRADVRGLACIEFARGQSYRARAVHVSTPLLSILVNKDKAPLPDTNAPTVLSGLFPSVNRELRIDSVNVTDGALHYSERVVPRARAGTLTFDNAQVSVWGLWNRADIADSARLSAIARFMNEGLLRIEMSTSPLSSGALLNCSGSLGAMELNRLNRFLEATEQKRIESGVLQSATFDLDVRSGHATGKVRAIYHDLHFKHLEKQDFLEKAATALVESFKIRRSNSPDGPRPVKAGRIEYFRRPDEGLGSFLWFSIRTGLWDIVGF